MGGSVPGMSDSNVRGATGAGARGVEPASSGRDPAAALADRFLGVSRRLRRGWLSGLEPWGISPHQARALRIVVRHGGLRLGMLAEELHVAPRSATDVVDALEQAGWVRREPDPGDRRAMVVVATPAGHEVAARADQARAAWADEVFAPLDETQRVQLTALLDAVLDTPTP